MPASDLYHLSKFTPGMDSSTVLALVRQKISYSDLLGLSMTELLDVPGMGARRVARIKLCLETAGVAWPRTQQECSCGACQRLLAAIAGHEVQIRASMTEAAAEMVRVSER